jgi:lysozyme
VSPTTTRVAVAALTLSAAGFVGLVQREGIELKAYADPVHGWAVPTIGAGSTEGVKRGDTITPVGAVVRTLREAQTYENSLRGCITAPLAQAEFDAYTQLAHNIGGRAFCTSTIVKRVNALDYRGGCNAILLWNRAGSQICSEPGNKVCGGLWKDRQRIHSLCMEANP